MATENALFVVCCLSLYFGGMDCGETCGLQRTDRETTKDANHGDMTESSGGDDEILAEWNRRKRIDSDSRKKIDSDSHQELVVEIDGVKYVDVSASKKPSLELARFNKSVVSVTAVDGGSCIVESLVMTKGYSLSQNLTSCKSLKNVTLTGNDWLCGNDWSWLVDVNDQLVVDYSQATCGDIRVSSNSTWNRRELGFTEGRAKSQTLGIEACPELCVKCTTYLTTELEFESLYVDCENMGIKDETVPVMPINTTHLYLESNQLRSTQNIIGRLKYLTDLRTIGLGCNKLDSLPYLDEEFPKLKQIHLQHNVIRELDLEAFKSIVRREDMVIQLQDNNFVCDCNAHFFMKIFLENTTKLKDFVYEPLRCTPPSSNTSQIITLRTDECEVPVRAAFNVLPYVIAILALLNCVFLYLVFDLVMAIKECQFNSTSLRDPKFHVLLKAIKSVPNLCRRNPSRAVEETPSPQQDVTVTLRRHPTVLADRASVIRRLERRPLTPGPR